MAKLWPKNGAHTHIWHKFFGYNSAICGLIGLKFFMGTEATIIYRFVMKNLNYNFIDHFWRENGRGQLNILARNGLGPPNPTKKLGHLLELLDQPLSRNYVLEIIRGDTPRL